MKKNVIYLLVLLLSSTLYSQKHEKAVSIIGSNMVKPKIFQQRNNKFYNIIESFSNYIFLENGKVIQAEYLEKKPQIKTYIVKYDNELNSEWIRSVVKYGGQIIDFKIAQDGYFYFSGNFVDLSMKLYDGTEIPGTLQTKFILKFDSNLKYQSIDLFSVKSSKFQYFDVDQNGDKYLCLDYNHDTLQFKNTNIFVADTTKTDIAVVKIDRTGDFKWMQYLKEGGFADNCNGIKVDNNGDVVICGSFQSYKIGIGNGITKPNHGMTDVVLAKYNKDGNPLWFEVIGGSDLESTPLIAIDSSNNVVLTCQFKSKQLVFPDNKVIDQFKYNDCIIVKYTSDGKFKWVNNLRSSDNDFINSLFIDNKSNIYITGKYSDTPLVLDKLTMMFLEKQDAYFAMISSEGKPIWLKQITGDEFEDCIGLALNSEGDIFTSGTFDGKNARFSKTRTVEKDNTYLSTFVSKYSSPTPPQLSEIILFDKKSDEVQLGFNYIDSMGIQVKTLGFYYSLNENPSILDNVTNNGKIQNLQARTKYYFRGYAQNYYGIGYSEQLAVITKSLGPEIIFPLPTDSILNNKVIMKWTEIPDVNNYSIQISTDSAFRMKNVNYISTQNTFEINNLQKDIQYFWRVCGYKELDSSDWSKPSKFKIQNSSRINEENEFAINIQSYPNPFSSIMNIQYSESIGCNVKILILDSYGRELDTVYDGYLPKGNYNYIWEPVNMASGVYYYQLRSDKVITKPIIFIK